MTSSLRTDAFTFMLSSFVTAALAITLFAIPVGAYEYTAAGTVTYSDFNQGQITRTTNYSFVAEMRGEGSRIRVNGGVYSGLEYAEYGWDGTNSHLLIKFSPSNSFKTVYKLEGGRTSSTELDVPVKARNEATIKLYAGNPMPQHNYGFEPVWLAFASSSYYRQKKSGEKLEPLWDMGREVRGSDIRFTAMWQLSDKSPHLVETMSDFYDGNIYTLAGDRLVSTRLPKPFEGEPTNSTYSVLEWTNFAGINLPRRFQVTRYVLNQNSQSRFFLQPLRVYEGTVDHIEPHVRSKSFAASVPNGIPTQVLDKRFANAHDPVATISYFSPSGGMLSVEEIKTNDVYKQAIGGREPRSESRNPRIIFIALMMLSILFPIWLLIRKKG